jgi:hypothetical protein
MKDKDCCQFTIFKQLYCERRTSQISYTYFQSTAARNELCRHSSIAAKKSPKVSLYLESMPSSVLNQLTPLVIVIALAGTLGLIHWMDRSTFRLFGTPQRSANQTKRLPLGDEEQGRTKPRRGSWVFPDTLPRSPRSSSTASLARNAVPPAYIPRTWQGESPPAAPPQPITDLPSLDHGYSPASCLKPQSPPYDPLFVLANDSTESLERAISPLELSPPQTRIPFARNSTESIETEVAEDFNPESTWSYFEAPAAPLTGMDPFPFHKPVPLNLQAQTRTGSVEGHRPMVVSPAGAEDTTASDFASRMARSRGKEHPQTSPQETGPHIRVSRHPTPSLNPGLVKISNARERWTKIDI